MSLVSQALTQYWRTVDMMGWRLTKVKVRGEEAELPDGYFMDESTDHQLVALYGPDGVIEYHLTGTSGETLYQQAMNNKKAGVVSLD